MPNQPLVSIGLLSYNRPEYLRRSLESLTGQTYKNIEIVLSDNCSTDEDVDKVAREFSEKDSRIIYIRQATNIGPSKNFQFVIEHSTGKYYMWATDDNWYDSNFISELVALLERDRNVVFAFCDYEAIGPDKIKITSYPDFLPILKKFVSNSQIMNLVKFIFQIECTGKCNLFYSIYRTDIIKSYDLESAYKKYGYWGHDNLIAFYILCKGHLALSDKLLFKITANNEKTCIIDYPEGESMAINQYLNSYYDIINSNFTGYKKYLLKAFVWLRIKFFAAIS